MTVLKVFAIAIVVSSGTAAAQTSPAIACRDLGTLGGGYSHAADINDHGEIVGVGTTTADETHAFLWTPATGMRDLGTLGGSFSAATAINDYGVVVGYSTVVPGDDAYHAFMWTADQGMVDLGPGQAMAVNDRGQAIGGDAHGAVMWIGGSQTIRLVSASGAPTTVGAVNDFSTVIGSVVNDGFVGTVSGGSIIVGSTIRDVDPRDLNNLGVVTGAIRSSGPRAFAWTATAGTVALAQLAGFHSSGRAVNDLGHIAGWSDGSQPGVRAALWRGSDAIDLGPLGGLEWNQGMAESVNNRGAVVGGSNTESGGWHATLWNVHLTPAERVESIGALLRKLFATGNLRGAHYRLLQRSLDRARRDMEADDVAGTRRTLGTVAHRFDALAQRGGIPEVFVGMVRDALASVFAETPPRPAVRIVQMPELGWGTLPADFNGDGITDLISATLVFGRPTGLVIALGQRHGTFAPPASLGMRAAPLAVGDFNADGKMDVIVSGIAILPGNGDGTFGAPREVTGPPGRPEGGVSSGTAVVADFNGDGRLDLALRTADSIDIYPGNGDFTFATKTSVPMAGFESRGTVIAADFNGDAKPDLAILNSDGVVQVAINQGGLVFDSSNTPVESGYETWDLAAGDLNNDGRVDLVAVGATFHGPGYTLGTVDTLLGNGDGTFQRPVAYDTGARGSITVVVGDFNSDNALDIATGNRSFDDDDSGYHYWDSVSILAGRGDGTFAPAARFHLDYVNSPDHNRYRNTHNHLAMADMNGDGRTDLIASEGAVLFNIRPRANRAPHVAIGYPQTGSDVGRQLCVSARISDPDFDALSIRWDGNGDNPPFPEFCRWFSETTTLRATVTDAQGASATDELVIVVPPEDGTFLWIDEPDAGETVSAHRPFTIRWNATAAAQDPRLARYQVSASFDDGRTLTPIEGCRHLPGTARECIWNENKHVTDLARIRVDAFDSAGNLVRFAVSGGFRTVRGPSTSLPDFWYDGDAGDVLITGGATYTDGTFSVTGAGMDIGGTDDAFHYAFTFANGDFEIVTRVASMEDVSPWTKAGLMLRANFFNGNAAHVSLLATPTAVNGISFQARQTDSGTTVEHARVLLAPPIWLKLARKGNTVEAAYRKSAADRWTTLGVATSTALTYSSVYAGLAVSSHVDGTLATATFTDVSVGAGSTITTDVPLGPRRNEPCEWNPRDRVVLTCGRASVARGSGDLTITARVGSLTNTYDWAKAGVIFYFGLPVTSHNTSPTATALFDDVSWSSGRTIY
jgi:probable HAF family extracellular repeat protein